MWKKDINKLLILYFLQSDFDYIPFTISVLNATKLLIFESYACPQKQICRL